MNRRLLLLAAGCVALVFTTASCSDSNGEAPLPGGGPDTPGNTETVDPSDDASPWAAQYDSTQIRAYERALQRFERYEEEAEPIWSAGDASEEAGELFKSYFIDPLWEEQFDTLELYAANEIEIEGTPEIYWSRPLRINGGANRVTIRQCVDYTAATGTNSGTPIEPHAWAKVPRQRTVILSKSSGTPWLIESIHDASSSARPKKCNP